MMSYVSQGPMLSGMVMASGILDPNMFATKNSTYDDFVNSFGLPGTNGGFSFPNFVTYETFEKHIQDRYGLVLAYTEKDTGLRTIIPLQQAVDMIYRFACISPFANAAVSLFEFNDEEASLEFEQPKSMTERRDALTLSEAQIEEYHKHKARDIGYNVITV